jgi:hypothetical protein
VNRALGADDYMSLELFVALTSQRVTDKQSASVYARPISSHAKQGEQGGEGGKKRNKRRKREGEKKRKRNDGLVTCVYDV